MIVVVVLLVGSVVAFELFAPAPPPVRIAFIDIWSPDDVCGLGTTQVSYYGYNSSTSVAVALEFPVPNFNSTPCTVRGVVTNSTGFSLSAVQAPVTIAAHGNATLNLTATSPSSSFSGDLELVFS